MLTFTYLLQSFEYCTLFLWISMCADLIILYLGSCSIGIGSCQLWSIWTAAVEEEDRGLGPAIMLPTQEILPQLTPSLPVNCTAHLQVPLKVEMIA